MAIFIFISSSGYEEGNRRLSQPGEGTAFAERVTMQARVLQADFIRHAQDFPIDQFTILKGSNDDATATAVSLYSPEHQPLKVLEFPWFDAPDEMLVNGQFHLMESIANTETVVVIASTEIVRRLYDQATRRYTIRSVELWLEETLEETLIGGRGYFVDVANSIAAALGRSRREIEATTPTD